MFHLPVRCALLLLASAVLAYAAPEELIPPVKLRPGDPTRFHPELVRLHEDGIEEIRALLRDDPKRAHFADAITKELLRKLPVDGECFARLLTASSRPVQDWTMRTMGEYAGDKSAALPQLLRIASDSSQPDAHRATAARVIGTTRMNQGVVAALVQQLPGASKELQVILLEVIATSGRAGAGSLPLLKHYLDVPQAAVQFHAFRAIQQIEETSDTPIPDPMAVLKTAQTPGYLTCVALLNLAAAVPTPPGATEVVLQKVGHFDPFVSELAANVLQKMRQNGTDLAALERGVMSSNATVRLRSLLQIRDLGATNVTKTLVTALQRVATQGASPQETGACLDALRMLGTNAAPAANLMVQLLDEQSPIYRDAQKHEVHRLRGFLLATLAETSVPESALPFIVAALANSDERSSIEFAGAARAAAALGPKARPAVPFLVRTLSERIDEDLIAFDKFDSHGASANVEYTTCQIEALRALRRIGPTDEPTVRAVRAFLEQPIPVLEQAKLFRKIPDVRTEATETLAAIAANGAAQD